MAEYMKVEPTMGLDAVAPRLEAKTATKDKENIRKALENDLGAEFKEMSYAGKEELVNTVAQSAKEIAATLRTKVEKDNGSLGKMLGTSDEALQKLVARYNTDMSTKITALQWRVEENISQLKNDLRTLSVKASTDSAKAASVNLEESMRRAGA